MKYSFFGAALCFCALLLAAGSAQAEITVSSPQEGDAVNAEPCPFDVCEGKFDWEFDVSGPAAQTIDIIYTGVPSGSRRQVICFTDSIEGAFCPTLPRTFTSDLMNSQGFSLPVGVWDASVHVSRNGSVEVSPPIRLTVNAVNLPPAGTIALSRVELNQGSPSIVLRDAIPDPNNPGTDLQSALFTAPTEVDIIGQNLHNNPFIEVYLAPKPFGEPQLTAESGLPVESWCRTEAEIIGREELPSGESKITVRMPDLPLELPTICGVNSGPPGKIFNKPNWRWAIRDRWIRPEREHTWWAIPSQRDVPWYDAPPFKVVKPAYPDIDGLGFANRKDDSTYKEFLTVFGNNAYICVGAFGICATRIADPLYHLIWFPIYKKAVNSSNGSCNGMSATSRLMANEDLQPEDFDQSVHFPAGFDSAGEPATYNDTNFCTPLCSPPKPRNLWAHIRMNHGVQISREFLFEILETLGEAVFDPNNLTSIKGVPNATLERVRNNPSGYVVCFFEPGSGHCVTPYRVTGNRIWIYDNNNPGDESRFIDIADGDYDYPARRADDKGPNQGNAIMAFPIDIWKNGRHLLGLSDFDLDFGGVDFLFAIVVGDADMTVNDGDGGRWGFEEDGSFSDSLPGAVSIPILGPNDEEASQMPLMIATNQAAPDVEIAAEGGQYYFYAGQGGSLLQLEASDAQSGDQDRLQLGYRDGNLGSFDFTPQRDASHLVPRVGLEIGPEESAVFQWLGLEVPGGGSVGFDSDPANRAVGFRNDTGVETQHVLALDYGSGETEAFGRMIYGPFDVPPGATHRVVAMGWPDVDELLSELDLDRDGNPDLTEVVKGRAVPAALDLGIEADLSVTTTSAPDAFAVGVAAEYHLLVENTGPNPATEVVLAAVVSGTPDVALIEASQGSCMQEVDGISCELGTVDVGDTVTLVYSATPTTAGPQTNAASVFGVEGDPDMTNNTSVSAGSDGSAGGGCNCRIDQTGGGMPATGYFFALLGAWALLRRRRSSSAGDL